MNSTRVGELSDEQFQKLFENAPFGSTVYKDQDGTVLKQGWLTYCEACGRTICNRPGCYCDLSHTAAETMPRHVGLPVSATCAGEASNTPSPAPFYSDEDIEMVKRIADPGERGGMFTRRRPNRFRSGPLTRMDRARVRLVLWLLKRHVSLLPGYDDRTWTPSRLRALNLMPGATRTAAPKPVNPYVFPPDPPELERSREEMIARMPPHSKTQPESAEKSAANRLSGDQKAGRVDHDR